MSEPIRRRVRHRAGTTLTLPDDPSRIVLRRRRCGEPPTQRRARREGQGVAWRQFSLVGLVLLAAGPVWALGEAVAEHYHEEIAQIFHRHSASAAWVMPGHDQVAPSVGPTASDAGTSSHGTGDMFASSRFVALSGTAAPARTAALPASAYSRDASAYRAPSFTPSAFFRAPAPVFETRGASRPVATVAGARATSATGVRPAAALGSATWSGASSVASSDPGWQTGNNWVGGTAPAPTGSADIIFTPTPAGATASNVNVNYAISSLTFQGPAGGANGGSAANTPSYNVNGSTGVTLTVGAGGINNASANKQTLSLPVALGAAQTWSVANATGNLEVDGVVSGTSALTKSGPGTLTFGGTGNNTYTGPISVTAGTLVLNKTGNVGVINATSGDLSIGNAGSSGASVDATVQLPNGAQQQTAYGVTNVTIYPDGAFNLADNSNTAINNLTMTGGTVSLGSNAVIQLDNITTNASATGALITSPNAGAALQIIDSTLTANVARSTSPGVIYDLDLQGSIVSGALVKTGAGVMRLAGTLTGTNFSVTLNAGTLAVASDVALGDNGEFPSPQPTTFTLAGGTVTADGGDRTLANPVALTGSATIGASLDGTPHALTFNGDLTVNGSQTLTVNNTALTTFAGAVNMSGNTLTMDGVGNTLIPGVVSGNADGGLTKQGAGTLTLTANNTYAGQTEVGNGKLFVNNVPVNFGDSGTGSGAVYVDPSVPGTWLGGTGTIGGNTVVGSYPAFNTPTFRGGARPQIVAGMATLTPGALVGGVSTPGILTFNGSLTLTSGTTTTELDIAAGTTPGTGYDQVRVGGNLVLAGDLTLNLAAGTKLTVGSTFYIFELTSTLATVTGTFDNANPDGTYTDSAGDVYAINYGANDPVDEDLAMNDVSLTVLSVPEPGTWAMFGLGAALGALGMTRRRVSAA